MRSLTLPAGLSDSALASTVAPSGFGMRLSLTSGVPPISSRTDAATRGRPLDDLFWVMARNPIGNADSRRKKMQRGPLGGRRKASESDEKGPAARRRPKAAGEAYCLWLARARQDL